MKAPFPFSDPRSHPVQAVMGNTWQLGDILAGLLAFLGPSNINVSTFSTGEEFLRRLLSLRKQGLVVQAHLWLDAKAAQKTARAMPLVRSTFDTVRLCENHSKVIALHPLSGESGALLLTSQNMTRGNRMEQYVLFGHGCQHIMRDIEQTLSQITSCQIWKNAQLA